MATPAIRVEGLGKRYRLAHGQARARYRTLRESLTGLVSAPFRKRSTVEEFWALNDVSFEVQPGEVVGIIGRNGAGKSTLLKILSRITKPTTGRVEINGRVGSLLEVGTGFHPELTGRENIYLNGSILGMSRKEIDRKFDEIVAFAEVKKFLDTPVKRYSSGMYVRLAFAVAAHLEPEILIVDEVLAVGDAEFQKKCLGKMGDVARQGRTVLLVSHQLDAVRRLCEHAALFERGCLKLQGSTAQVLDGYLRSGPEEASPGEWIELTGAARQGTGGARYSAVKYHSTEANGHARADGDLEVTVRIESDADRVIPSLAVAIYDRYGTKLVNADTLALGSDVQLHRGTNELVVRIAELHLNPGIYLVGLWLSTPPITLDYLAEAFVIDVQPKPTRDFGTRPKADGLLALIAGDRQTQDTS
jgi:homopolymeric O-antigen transport system ATP-binding protein